MGGWVRYLQLQAKAKTGFSTGLLICAIIAVLALAGAVLFLVKAAYIWLAIRYGAVDASLIMAAAFFAIAVIGGLCSIIMYRSSVSRARRALAERRNTPWLDPSLLAVGVKLGSSVGSSIGWRRLISLGAVAVLAAGLGREWFGHNARGEHGEDAGDGS
jgi:hypothetical protein